jgi:hypothetical protein
MMHAPMDAAEDTTTLKVHCTSPLLESADLLLSPDSAWLLSSCSDTTAHTSRSSGTSPVEAAGAQLARALLTTSVTTGRRLSSRSLSLGSRSLSVIRETALPPSSTSDSGHSTTSGVSLDLDHPGSAPAPLTAWASVPPGLLPLSCRVRAVHPIDERASWPNAITASSGCFSANDAGHPASAPAQSPRSPCWGWPADDDLRTSAADYARPCSLDAEPSFDSLMADGGPEKARGGR